MSDDIEIILTDSIDIGNQMINYWNVTMKQWNEIMRK